MSAAATTAATKTVLITGSNSGIGFEACKILAQKGEYTLIMACRSLEKAQDAIDRILQKDKAESSSSGDAVNNGKLIPAECDLESLASIKAFSEKLPELIGGGGENGKIDIVCLNAGLALKSGTKEVARTQDGFELTVGVNHFGHFYLNSLILPLVSPNGGKIVVTASSVHDPDSKGGSDGGNGATLGDMAGLEQRGKDCEMIDGGSFDAQKAYRDSKLCNVLFTRELQRRLTESGKKVSVNCFSPGLILESGIFRHQSLIFKWLFSFAASWIFKISETSEWGGGCLAYMVTSVNGDDEYDGGKYYCAPSGSSKFGEAAYGNQFQATNVSKEAMDDAKAKGLWELSEKVLGLSSSSSS